MAEALAAAGVPPTARPEQLTRRITPTFPTRCLRFGDRFVLLKTAVLLCILWYYDMKYQARIPVQTKEITAQSLCGPLLKRKGSIHL